MSGVFNKKNWGENAWIQINIKESLLDSNLKKRCHPEVPHFQKRVVQYNPNSRTHQPIQKTKFRRNRHHSTYPYPFTKNISRNTQYTKYHTHTRALIHTKIPPEVKQKINRQHIVSTSSTRHSRTVGLSDCLLPQPAGLSVVPLVKEMETSLLAPLAWKNWTFRPVAGGKPRCKQTWLCLGKKKRREEENFDLRCRFGKEPISNNWFTGKRLISLLNYTCNLSIYLIHN